LEKDLKANNLKLYKKEGSTIQIISFPNEEVRKGDYLIIEDQNKGRSLIVQVIDLDYANIPGILDELLRSYNGDPTIEGHDIDPFEIASQIRYIQDTRLLICKIRASTNNNKLNPTGSYLPNRSSARIQHVSMNELLDHPSNLQRYAIHIGETTDKKRIDVDIRALDGALNIITGKKGTGKSHISKLLTLNLVNHGAPVVILDLNGEYVGLGRNVDGKPNEFYSKIHVLTPKTNFKVTLEQIGVRVLLNILINVLQLPGTSAREFKRILYFLRRKGTLTIEELGRTIENWRCNQHIRDALFSRYHTFRSSKIFTDDPKEASTLEDSLAQARSGGAIILNLKNESTMNRFIMVEYILGKLVELLASWKFQAIFLFAEEAHLYLRETYWDDIVTRMRHFGLFTTFISNQPDTIRENMYRQADNLFVLNFTNEHDLDPISRAAKVDVDTVKSIVRDLLPHNTLILGRIVNDLPVVVQIKKLDVQTMGQTRLFFNKDSKINPKSYQLNIIGNLQT
jgi:DNA helicase HerA-like ATPase